MTCEICGDEIVPCEEVIRGEKGARFHSDCFLAEKGVPEEMIPFFTISQSSDDKVTATFWNPNLMGWQNSTRF